MVPDANGDFSVSFAIPNEIPEGVQTITSFGAGNFVSTPFAVTIPNEPIGAGPLFDQPLVGGLPMDNCLSFATNCGDPAAEYFCRTHGYPGFLELGDKPLPTDKNVGNHVTTCTAPVLPFAWQSF